GIVAGPALAAASAGVLMLALLPFAAIFAGRRDFPSTSAIAWSGFGALALSSLLFVFVLAADVLFLRSWFDARLVTGAVLGCVLPLIAVGGWRARRPAVVRVTVPIRNLARDLHGF